MIRNLPVHLNLRWPLLSSLIIKLSNSKPKNEDVYKVLAEIVSESCKKLNENGKFKMSLRKNH